MRRPPARSRHPPGGARLAAQGAAGRTAFPGRSTTGEQAAFPCCLIPRALLLRLFSHPASTVATIVSQPVGGEAREGGGSGMRQRAS